MVRQHTKRGPKARPRPGSNGDDQTTLRVSNVVRDYVLRKSRKYETIDCALRRLLGIRPCRMKT